MMKQLFTLAKSIFNLLSSVLNKFSADINYAVLSCIRLCDNTALLKINTKIVPVCFVQIPKVLGGNMLVKTLQSQELKDETFKDFC